MWKKYLSTIGENINNTGKIYESWYFCNNEEDANELAELVKKGIKKATASLHCLYGIENEPIPEVGDYIIIINWAGIAPVSYTHLRAHETRHDLVCRLL